LVLSVCEATVLAELAEPCLFEEAAHHCFVVAVGHCVVVLLLLVDFVYVVLGERVGAISELVQAVRKVTAAAPLAAEALHKVLTHRRFEFAVEGREVGLDGSFNLKIVQLCFVFLASPLSFFGP
jgi:hypothetical protein